MLHLIIRSWGDWVLCPRAGAFKWGACRAHATGVQPPQETGQGVSIWIISRLILGDSMEKHTSLAATSLQDLQNLPCCPARPPVHGLLAGFSSLCTLSSSICCAPSVLLGSLERMSLPSWHLWHFRGFKAGPVEHTVLTTCNFCLLVSPCCLQVLGGSGGLEAQKKQFGDLVVFCLNDAFKDL